MKTDHTAPKSIDDCIAVFSPEVRPILEKIRVTIRKAAPDEEEKISYKMPTFTLKGNLVCFAAFKKHIPPVAGDEKLRNKNSIYQGEKRNLRLPLDKPIPYALIGKFVKTRVRENLKRANAQRKKR